MHPARHAYLSAFQRWHARVAAGRTTAVRPRRPEGRVFAAPRRLAGDAGRRRPAYDVILAGDWTTAGGAAAAGTGQLRALAARGRAVAVLHLDALASLADGPQNLDPGVQDLINAGELDQVVLADEVHARLVVVRGPAVLHFAPGHPGGLRADRVVIEVDAAGGYAADVCVAASRRLFGAEPLWSPAGPANRRALGAGPLGAALAAADLPGTVDVRQWRLDRPGLRSDRPVIGRECTGGREEWRRLREVLRDSGRLDVRLLDRAGDARAAFGHPGPPRTWLVYQPSDVTLRSFLHQVDFYLHLPPEHASRDAEPALLTALAAGCVLLLPHRYAPTFGDAAVYCEPAEIAGTVQRLHRRRDEFLAQSARGREFVRRRYGHDRYAERIGELTA
jgi:hypothetical protein